jgi:PAS domain S-box-containing protein
MPRGAGHAVVIASIEHASKIDPVRPTARVVGPALGRGLMASRDSNDAERAIRAILNALPAMVGYWDRDLRNVMANDAYVEFFGKSPAEMRGTHISELLGPELYEKNLPHMEGALAGERQLFDREIRTPSGQRRYTQASYIPDEVDGEVRGFFVLVTDITERRQSEEDVERSRTRLAEAERVARLGSWEWDVESNTVLWSDGLYTLYGIDRQDFDPRYEPGGSRYVHPEDRERVEAEVRSTLETGAPIDFEYRIVRPDGRIRRLHSRAEAIVDPDGRALRVMGTAQDVTEVRAAAEALHQTAADLGRRAVELHRLPNHGERQRPDLARLLTPRQLEVLTLVAQGLSNAQIGDRLFLSESTVKWHVRKILGALGVSNRAQAVARYLSD